MRLRSYIPLYSVTISTELGHITLSGWDVVVGGVSETCTVSLGASDVYRSTLKFYFLTPSWSCKLDGKHKRRKWLLSTHMAAGTRLFFSFSDLPEQALVHAVKGRDILLLPGGHVTSHDPPPDPIHHLAVAHCVVGRVLTIQGKYP